MNLSTTSNAGVKLNYMPPKSADLLETLTVAQLGKKFPAFNGIRSPSLSA